MSEAFATALKSPLADLITSYVAERRAIGYRCEAEARLLCRLDRFGHSCARRPKSFHYL